MTKSINVLVLFLVLTASCKGQVEEEKSIRDAFSNYKSSILNDKGQEAVKYVDSRTIKYYSDILEYVKNADSAKVNSLPFIDKFTVLSIRFRTSKEDILAFDGKGLFVYAIESGMVGKNSVVNTSIGEIILDNDFAKGQFVSNGQKSPFYFHFYKEAGQWKIDITSIFSVSTMAIKKMVEDSGQNENEYIFSLLEIVAGKKPERTIWDPVK